MKNDWKQNLNEMKTMTHLREGDIVKLVTGSSEMRISSVYEDSTLVECETIRGGKLCKYYFRPESLIITRKDLI
ncbi:hypothetical protein QQ008_24200 [Fulvivirgaceae bacterium BMA10]|uniref:Uncharacterized protein n=1 Tax=Splendidivirga corallicola TaxID=3051826 RepID=A0ABT8KWJ5_9BACT|nr:hypothetical protein [Fulvivirgaceae bacterium BMA10]